MNCLHCHTELEQAASGRPRRYCSATCRQRAYRQRTRATADAAGIVALARHLRDNADRLWLLAHGWQPPLDWSGPRSLADLAADTARLAARLAGVERVRLPEPRTGDETSNESTACRHPDR